jgi:predicted CopG family antitoxin
MRRRTTILLEDEVYRKLVQEAVEKYGSTKKLSLLINQKLKGEERGSKPSRRITIRLGKKLKPDEIERLIEKGWSEAIGWRRR